MIRDCYIELWKPGDIIIFNEWPLDEFQFISFNDDNTVRMKCNTEGGRYSMFDIDYFRGRKITNLRLETLRKIQLWKEL